eukprot:ANDGO_00860.mRNA.1 Serine/arginine-rich splicing factor SR30
MSKRLFVGHIAREVSRGDIESAFSRFGPIDQVDLKGSFAFVEYSAPEAAEAALREMNNATLGPQSINVELAKGRGDRPERSDRDRDFRDRDRDFRGGDRDRDRDFRGGDRDRDRDFRGGDRDRPRAPEFRLRIDGLNPSVSWQDLKDHFKTFGEVRFAQVDRDRRGSGTIVYGNQDDADKAIRDCDGTQFRDAQITVRLDDRPPRDRDFRGGDRDFRGGDRRDFRGGDRRDFRGGDRDRFPRRDRDEPYSRRPRDDDRDDRRDRDREERRASPPSSPRRD